MLDIKYPYLPEERKIEYVSADNQFIRCARFFARLQSLDRTMPGAAVVVKDDEIIGTGANGSDYHTKHDCERVRRKCKTGEGYELCEGCHPKNHSEPRAILNAKTLGYDTQDADLYLWGHWWCCKWCWDIMIEAGIRRIFLMERSEILFNKNHPDNVIGNQFRNAP